jgi:hypothetical protein
LMTCVLPDFYGHAGQKCVDRRGKHRHLVSQFITPLTQSKDFDEKNRELLSEI